MSSENKNNAQIPRYLEFFLLQCQITLGPRVYVRPDLKLRTNAWQERTDENGVLDCTGWVRQVGMRPGHTGQIN